jgi:hybrid cluster-associated redox disulfide protein
MDDHTPNLPTPAEAAPNADTPAIHKDMLMSEIIDRFPQTGEVMMEYGLHCFGCHFSVFDTIEQGARIHGFGDEEIGQLVRDLNAVL